MNTLRNKVQLVGNLGANPEMKTLDGNKRMARFTLATNDVYKNDKGELVKDTTWHNIVAWGKTAELVENHLEKGKQVIVEGRISNRNYTDKDGIKRYVSEIIINELLLLGDKQ